MSKAYAKGPESTIQSYFTNNLAPPKTKAFILKLGYLEADDGHFLTMANCQTKSQFDAGINPTHSWRKLVMYSVLIDHPTAGLILWEVGPGKLETYKDHWGGLVCEIFAPVEEEKSKNLDEAIAEYGYKIEDVKHVILGHLHMDHAGGLEFFKGREDVTIWAHEIELKHAFWSIATNVPGYLPYCLDLNLNWVTFNDTVYDLFPGVSTHLSPGHTPGLVILQLNLENDGTIFFTSDHTVVKENYEGEAVTQGWLLRDHLGWLNSNQKLKQLQTHTNGLVVFGHDIQTLADLMEGRGRDYLE